MKLKLDKQKVTNLSSGDMENIKGGGQGWSNFRTGNCRYSENNPLEYLDCDGETLHLVGCQATSKG